MKRPLLGFLAAATLSFGLVGSAPALAHDGDDHDTRKHPRNYHTPYHGDKDDHDHDHDGRGRRRKQCEGLITICLL